MVKITVYTVEGQPTFTVPDDTTAAQVRHMVEDRYGWVGIGVQHSWVGVRV
jgi:hypothetical protein